MTLTGYNSPQPLPTGDGQLVSPVAQELVAWEGRRTGSPAIADQVCEDLQQRIDWGTSKYGTPLKTHNGRDAKIDAYQEVLDAIHYYQQDLMEQDSTETYSDLYLLCQIAMRMRMRLNDRS